MKKRNVFFTGERNISKINNFHNLIQTKNIKFTKIII